MAIQEFPIWVVMFYVLEFTLHLLREDAELNFELPNLKCIEIETCIFCTTNPCHWVYLLTSGRTKQRLISCIYTPELERYKRSGVCFHI